MTKKQTSEAEYCKGSTCNVESILSIDERGQLVLPKEVRDKAKIKGGDKLALISWNKKGDILCFTLMKTEYLGNQIQDLLNPILNN